MKRPNFLFLFPDQHRGDWMPYADAVLEKTGMQRLPLHMPHMEKLMSNGTVFTRAVTPSPLCAPARACLASGLRYDACGVRDNQDNYPVNQKTFYSVLKENGYSVGGVGKFDLHKGSHWWGLNGWVPELGLMGFTHAVDNEGKIDAIISGEAGPKGPYMKYLYDHHLEDLHILDMKERIGKGHILNADPTPVPKEAYCDNWLTGNGLAMLRDFPKDRPWFLQVNFTGPHSPWDITPGMKRRWEQAEFPPANRCDAFENEKLNAVRQNYAAMLENIDRNIGLLLAEVNRRGELENTVVLYASDHGEMLGDCNLFGKSRPYRSSVHIPLLVSGPGVLRNHVSEALVELQDLAATILDFVGLHMEEAPESLSLLPLLQGKVMEHRNYVLSALLDWEVIYSGNYKLVCESGNWTGLFDMEADPWENHNVLHAKPDIADRLQALHPTARVQKKL